ncbi:MAG: tail fiber protein [Lachnospiraceae bacterium]
MTFTELNEIKKSYKVLELAVDFINPSYNISRAKHLDNSRYILCTLTENGIPRSVKTNEVARIRLQKPDKTYVYNECDVLEDGRVLITLTEQILAVEGNAVCDIQLVDEQTEIIYSTKNFIINIDKTAVNNSVIASSNEFDALNKLIATNKKINEELKANEKVRQENESERIENENERKGNEADRQNAESERVNAENVRKANENVRISNENTRKVNETVRQNQEADRQTNTAAAIENAEKATKKANDAADDLQYKLDTHHFVLTEDKDVADGVPSLDNHKKVPVAELYEATTSSKGITQLTNSVSSTSTSTAATPNSVKTAYDKAISAANDVKTHNSSSTAHIDIRNLISALTTRLNTLADSDDTTLDQLSEIVAYIKNNKSLIDGITTSKINVSDIIDNLTSSVTNKPLSAKQGKVLNDLITALTTTVGNKVDKVSGKGLSSNDYTTEEKNKLAGIITGANKTIVDSVLSDSSINPVQNKIIKAELDKKLATSICNVSSQNTSNYQWHRIAYTDTITGAFSDKDVIIMIKGNYSTGPFGIVKISVRANGEGQTGSCTLRWIIRQGYSIDAVQAGFHNVYGSIYADLFLKVGTYARTNVTLLYIGGNGWNLCNSSEGSNGGKGSNVYTSITNAGTELRGKAYSSIIVAEDGSIVLAATKATNDSAGNQIHTTYIKGLSANGKTITYTKGNGTTGTITTQDTTYSNMLGATTSAAGKAGLVPAPAAGKQASFLRGDGTWQIPTNTTYSTATQSASGLMSAADKKKLDGIAANANNYTHPTTAGNKHIPSGGSSGQILRWSADGTAVWGSDNNTTYSTATQLANGLMSSTDKKKLDGIATNANNYTHPTTAGNKHIPSGGSSGQILRWSADGTAVWGSDNNTTYSNMTAATASAAGKAGLVPAPAAGKQASFLRGDGTWATPTDTNTWRGITDSLTSTSTTTSLSAKAGKSLKDSIDIINNNLKQNTTGKFILPNGLKICWGKSKPPNTNGYIRSTVVNFPVTFNAVPVVCVTKLVSNSYTECGVTSAVGTITEKQFNIKAMYQETSLSDLEVELQWIAIGY